MADGIAMKFEARGTKVKVLLSKTAFASIEQQALAAERQETGGILIGRYDSIGDVAIVQEATARPRDSKSGWSWFQRGSSGLRSLLRKRWSEGDYYLGEWHSHPGAAPDPSGNDINEMRAISREPTYVCPKPILIIAGTPFRTLRLSVSVFEGGMLLPLQRVLDEPKFEPRPLSAADAGSIITSAQLKKQSPDENDFHGVW